MLCGVAPAVAQTPLRPTHSRARVYRARSSPIGSDVTNGTHIVDVGLLQLEIGGLYTIPVAGQHAFGTPFTARVGLFDWLEARIGTDGLLLQQDVSSLVTGVGRTGVQVGAKIRLWADPGGIPVLSILLRRSTFRPQAPTRGSDQAIRTTRWRC